MSAARTAIPIMLVCAAVLAVFTSFGPNSTRPATIALSWGMSAMLVASATAFWRTPPEVLDRRGAFVPTALAAVLVVCTMNWLTQDPSAAAQAFLCFPVLWAAQNLHRGAALGVAVFAAAANGVVLLHLEELVSALTDTVFFGAVLIVVSVMLVRAGDRQAGLVTALRRQADVDSLTGLANRRFLDDALGRALAAQPCGDGTALVLVDVDSFKAINDRHGHPVGDEALVHLAGVLRSVVRSGDAVLSRMGGDELALLLPGVPADAAQRRAAEVLEAVRSRPLALADGTLLALSVSLGVAHAPLHATGIEQLYAAADAALYEAKRAGRGRVAVAT